SIASVNVAGLAFAQRTLIVMNARLGNEAKCRVATRAESGEEGEEERGENAAGKFAAQPLRDDGRKGAVRGGNKQAREANALGLVGIEERFIGAALRHLCEFPAEIYGIANAGVHAL